jgi:hypothetical protein
LRFFGPEPALPSLQARCRHHAGTVRKARVNCRARRRAHGVWPDDENDQHAAAHLGAHRHWPSARTERGGLGADIDCGDARPPHAGRISLG